MLSYPSSDLPPYATLPVYESVLDRDAVARTRPGALDELLADSGTRFLVARRGLTLARGAGLALLPLAELPEGVLDGAEAIVYLGRSDDAEAPEPVGTPVVAVAVSETAKELLDAALAADDSLAAARWANLRELGGDASGRDRELLSTALALINWHASHG